MSRRGRVSKKQCYKYNDMFYRGRENYPDETVDLFTQTASATPEDLARDWKLESMTKRPVITVPLAETLRDAM